MSDRVYCYPNDANRVFREIIDELDDGQEQSGSTDSKARSDGILRLEGKELNDALFKRG